MENPQRCASTANGSIDETLAISGPLPSRFRLKYFSRMVVPRAIDQIGQSETTFEDRASFLSEKSSRDETESTLLGFMEFMVFKKTGNFEWLTNCIKHLEQALEGSDSKSTHETKRAVMRHNLAVFKVQKFDVTEDAKDLQSSIHAAEEAKRFASVFSLPDNDAEHDLALLRKCTVRTISESSGDDTQGAVEAFAALESHCEDGETIYRILQGDRSLLCRKLRETLMSPTIMLPARSKLAECLALSAFYRSCENGLYYGDPDLVEDLSFIANDLEMLDRRLARCIYLGTLGYNLDRKYIHDRENLQETNKALLMRAEEILGSAVLYHLDPQEMVSDVFRRHPLLVIGNHWGDFLHFPGFPARTAGPGSIRFTRIFYVSILAAVKLQLYGITGEDHYLDDCERLSQEAFDAKDTWGSSLGIPGLTLAESCHWRYSKSNRPSQDFHVLEKGMSVLDQLCLLPLSPDDRLKVEIYKCKLAVELSSHYSDEKNVGIINEALARGEVVRRGMKGVSLDTLGHLSVLSKLYMDRSMYPCSDSNKLFNNAFSSALEGVMAADKLGTGRRFNQTNMAIARAKARQPYEMWFRIRFQHTNDRGFLRQSIEVNRESISILGEADLSYPVVGDLLLEFQERLARYRCTLLDLTDTVDDLKQVTESIDWARARLASVEDGARTKKNLKLVLCMCLFTRHCSNDQVYASDLDELLSTVSQIKEVDFSLTLCNILSQLYKKTQVPAILDEALDCAAIVTSSLEESTHKDLLSSSEDPKTSHMTLLSRLLDVAELYLMRFRRQEGLDWSHDAEMALKYSLRCVGDHSTSPTVYIAAANLLSDPIFVSSGKIDKAELAAMTKRAVRLLPKVLPRSLCRRDIQKALRSYGGVASNAAAAALEAGRGEDEAIELLEAGRGLLTTQLLDVRSIDIKRHQTSDTVKMSQLKEKLQQLEMVTSSDDMSAHSTPGVHHAQRRAFTLNEEIEAMVNDIEGPTSNDIGLLRSPTAADMKAFICDGAIVVLNVSFRSDAIIIHKGKVESLSLPLLTSEVAGNLANVFEVIRTNSGTEFVRFLQETTMVATFRYLWEAIVGPVLNFLGFNHTHSPGEAWPRVWWIATGYLNQFPFHAAEHLSDDGTVRNTLDYVVSSYSPSIRGLLFTSQNLHYRKTPISRNDPLILVSMGKTQGLRSLPFAVSEARAIESLLCESVRVQRLQEPNKKEVLDALQECNVFHFAGHGISLIGDPDQGSLFVRDWEKDSLSLRDILNVKLHLRVPWLAYLSACSTGVGDAAELRDESIHLVSAFQIAGFQHVVGSFWQVSDSLSQRVAESFYGDLKGGLGEGNDVALALHHDVRKLRRVSSGLPKPGARAESPFNPEEGTLHASTGAVPTQEEDDDPDIRKRLKSLKDNLADLHILAERQHPRDGELVQVSKPRVREVSSNTRLWAPYFHTGL